MGDRAVAGDVLDGVTEGVSQVQARRGRAQRILGDDGGLRADAQLDRLDEGIRITPRHGVRAGFDLRERLLACEHRGLDDLAESARVLGVVEGREDLGVAEHLGGLVEGACEVLSRVEVDGGLAADRRVDLGEERGRDLDHGQAALEERCAEAREVAHRAAAVGHEDGAAGERGPCAELERLPEDGERLDVLAAVELQRRPPCGERTVGGEHSGVSDGRDAPVARDARGDLAGARAKPRAHEHVVAVRAELEPDAARCVRRAHAGPAVEASLAAARSRRARLRRIMSS